MQTKIKDIYTGKPDARDEVMQPNSTFFKSFIMPPNFEIEDLIAGDKCFIRGYKGSGKTALLLYINDYIHNNYPNAVSSFMYFKEYNNIDRNHMDIVTSKYRNQTEENVIFDRKALLKEQSFVYIWRWIIFSRIIEDDDNSASPLFMRDNEWDLFTKKLNKITYKKIGDKISKFPKTLEISLGYSNLILSSEMSFSSKINVKAYEAFTNIIDEAAQHFVNLKRTETPYYIFLDELEAYFSDEMIFKRDLTMLRDLIFVTKEINNVFILWKHSNTKILCSIRTEIINSINRNIPANELNKATGGFEKVLSWDYANTTALQHPIFQILLKRIELTENNNNVYFADQGELFKKWFSNQINNNDPVSVIINHTWNKPRDIVRMLLAAENSIACNETTFSTNVFSQLINEYSNESLKEIIEELNALYTPKDIDAIISLFRGFSAIFSLQELKIKVSENYSNTIWNNNEINILMDLYRIGFLGNMEKGTKTSAWQHRGNQGPIFNDDWLFVVHRALRKVLLISSRQDETKKRYPKIKSGDKYSVSVVKVYPKLVLVKFTIKDYIFNGAINNPNEYYYVENQMLDCEVIKYDSEHKKWILKIV